MKENSSISILLLIILSVCFIASCNLNAGLGGASDSISMSKNLGVFVCEYEARPNPYYINDTIYFTVKEAWLEFTWGQTKDFRASSLYNRYQLIIVTEENIRRKYPKMTFDWTIGVDGKKYIRFAGQNSMIGDFDTIPKAEREVWKVMKGRLSNYPANIIIGEFILYKK